MNTIGKCLAALEVSAEDLRECVDLHHEFGKIKKGYYKQALLQHPDKGGDEKSFQILQASFEVLRELYEENQDSFFSFATAEKRRTHFAKTFRDFKSRPNPSYDFYSKGAVDETIIPAYRVEYARSNRSSCLATGKSKMCPLGEELILKGELRIGIFNPQSGSFGRWHHLSCWRVPMKVWLGLPLPEEYSDPQLFEKALLSMNEVLLSGYSDLSPPDRREVALHVMKKDNWARATAKKSTTITKPTGKGKLSQETSALVPSQKVHDLQIPLSPQTSPSDTLKGLRIVLTGRFPEVGGGFGLREGKDRAKQIIESFGGRVTSAVSGKTNILLVGQEPGFKKVSTARERNIPLLTLEELEEGIVEGNLDHLIERAESTPLKIKDYSPGFTGRMIDNAPAKRHSLLTMTPTKRRRLLK